MSVDIGRAIGAAMDCKTENASQLELELYFLIAKYLSIGPCQNAFKVLRAEMAKHKLLPKRVDWSGQEHFNTFGNLVLTNRHISSNHLLELARRLLTLVNQNSGPCPKGLNSLLGAGQFSALRTEEGSKHTTWKSMSYAALRHGRPVKPPHNLLHTPNIMGILPCREMSGTSRMELLMSSQMYSKMSLLFHSLGHLSSVYCVLFDRTGHFIFTGSDDNLVKVWSAISGRLLYTFRGHAAEINDMAVSFNNRLLAVGSCDKLIRIWCLRTSAPVAILHGHTHMITSLRFSPYTKGTTNYLASTGGDGCLCVWEYNMKTDFFNPKPIKFVEKSRAGAQMLCLSFSAGGSFLATGSSDHVVRVYSLGGRVPEKICELESHNDRIDSVQYSNSDLRFLTGSKDGYARIWRYERQEWKAVVLSMAENDGVTKNDDSGDWSLPQRKVTMVCWMVDDAYVVTAVSDFTIKVWNSSTGQLCHTLKGHADEVFVLEPNPMDRRVLLSAGHDGNIFFWDVVTGQKIRTIKNTIEGQGHGAVFDCKWSPDGQSFAATDSHGYLLYFGFGSNERYKKLPEEIYFHTDYRPLVRDGQSNVLDEQTQVPPHLLPPPFLVDIDGNPHHPRYQRLVPGREDCNDTQLIPLVVVAPNGNREVVDDLTGELRGGEFEEELMAGFVEEPASGNAEDRPIIDEMIARMQQEQDLQMMRNSNDQPEQQRRQTSSLSSVRVSTRSQSLNNTNASNGSTGASVGQSSNSQPVEPSSSSVRSQALAANSAPASQQVPPPRSSSPDFHQAQQPANMCIWKQRDLVKQLDVNVVKTFFENKAFQAEEERGKFLVERKKKPILAIIQHLEDANDLNSFARTRTMKQKRAKMLSTGRNEERGRNRLERRALYDTDESEQEGSVALEEEEEEMMSKDDSFHNISKDRDSSDDSASTIYSNWSPDGRTFQPPTRQSQRHKKKSWDTWKKAMDNSESERDTEVEMDTTLDEKGKKLKGKVNGIPGGKNRPRNSSKKKVEDSSNDDSSNEGAVETDLHGDDSFEKMARVGGKIHKSKVSMLQNKKTAARIKQHTRINGEVLEVPPEFRPPEWLTSSIPHKTPYFPQMGDEVIYFLQGHQQYVEAVRNTNAYRIDTAQKTLPWLKLPHLREQELMKVIGIKYEIQPPRLVCLKLAFIDPETSKLTGGSFTIKYHDMVGVIDFVVLRHTYNVAMTRDWSPSDNFRCLIDDAWWHGAILRHEPFQEDYPDSMFQCYVVQWDNGEQERLSPWDFEPVDENRRPDAPGGNIPVTREELLSTRYPPDCKPHEWPRIGCDAECDRIVGGLERIMDLSIAEPFLVPVDLNAFPLYALVIEYPIDLSLIKERLLNRFYRRLAAVQYDVRHIEANARAFNEPSSQIVKSARIVTELCLAFIGDPACYDPMPLYYEMTQRSTQSRNGVRSNEEDEGDNHASSYAATRRRTRHARISERLRLNIHNNRNNWKEHCLKLLDIVLRSPDSLPFQHPVDVMEFPDYLYVIQQPMDLSTIRNNLESDVYNNPNEFCRDVRLIFSNSRYYNTNKRSAIYVMTLRLSAMFEEQLKITLKGIKESKKESSGKTAAHLKAFSSFKKSSHSGTSGSSRLANSTLSTLNSSGGSARDGPGDGSSRRHDVDGNAHPDGGGSSIHQSRNAKRRRVESDEDEDDDDDDDDESNESILPTTDQRREERSLRSGAKPINGEGGNHHEHGHQSKRMKQDEDCHGEKREEPGYANHDKVRQKSKSKNPKAQKKASRESRTENGCLYKDDVEDEELEGDDDDDDGDQTSDADFSLSSYHRRKAEMKGRKHKKNKKSKKDKNKKRKRNAYYDDDEEEEEEEEEEDEDDDDVDEEEEEEDDDKERRYKRKRKVGKKSHSLPHRPDSRGERYGTRCATGSIKRRRYNREFEEDDLNATTESGVFQRLDDTSYPAIAYGKRSLRSRHSRDSNDDNNRATTTATATSATAQLFGRSLTLRLSRNDVDRLGNASTVSQRSHPPNKSNYMEDDDNTKGSSTTSGSKSNRRNSSESEAESDQAVDRRKFTNVKGSSSTSGSTEKNRGSDEEEDDDETEDDSEDNSDGSDTETYSNRSGPSKARLRSAAKVDARSATVVITKRRNSNSPKARTGYRTRNQGRRTIQYGEQDDNEDEAGERVVGVSSRGRPQRPNVRLTSMIRH